MTVERGDVVAVGCDGVASLANEELFRSQVESIVIDRDLDAFLSHFAADCVFRDMSEAHSLIGHLELRQYMSGYLDAMAHMEVEYLSLRSGADFVVGEFLLHGLYQGPGAGPGGTTVSLRYCVIDEVRDGLVVRETAYPVPNQLERQLESATCPEGAR
jgi:hypothetical protein